tara:strand:+ start:865 stop:1740 length:876 start_codon:yes stop_codon:yes gene_type:complete
MQHTTVNINGQIASGDKATIPVLDHGFLFGEGVYETLRTYHGKPFLLERHLDRLNSSADSIGLSSSFSDSEIREQITKTIAAATSESEYYIRILLTRGTGELSYDPAPCKKPTTVIIVKPHLDGGPQEMSGGIHVIVSSVIRNHPRALNPLIKSNNLLNSALAMQEALRNGATEALMLNHRGEIAECAQANYFLVHNGEALTPSLASGLLEGVTRNFLFEVGLSVGITVRETVLRESDLATAEEMFITSTTREVLPITSLDDKLVNGGNPGPVTKKLSKAFRLRALELSKP